MNISALSGRLYPRIVLLVFVSIVSVFVLTLMILNNERTRTFFLAQQTPVIDRMARLVQGLETAPPRQRQIMANRFDAPNFRIELGELHTISWWG